LRLEIHDGYVRSRSSTALSSASVLTMNARVRRPGASAAVIASAVERRTSRSGDMSRESATSSGWPSTLTCAISSANRRDQAALPVCAFSAMSFSSGSESRCGR
jgi:hypothetical protein